MVVVDGTAVKLRSKNPNESPNPANKRTSDRISCLSDQLVSLFNKNAPNAVTEPTKRQVNVSIITWCYVVCLASIDIFCQ